MCLGPMWPSASVRTDSAGATPEDATRDVVPAPQERREERAGRNKRMRGAQREQ